MVNVFGEAKVTGGFTISALNSAFNALSAAGGPTKIGSVRDIQLIRGKTRKSIDLYTFMNNPAEQFKFDLQNNDIIFVPVIKSLVSIEGAVKRPMQYEMLPGETLTDLIKYAGGLNMNVFPDFVQVQRYVNGEVKLLEWNLSEVLSGKTKVELENGDVVRIKSISKPMDQYVIIEGSVYYPGQYDLTANPSLSKLLENSKPTFEAKTDVLFVERIRPDNTTEILTVPFPGVKGSADFTLQARDKVTVTNQAAYRDVATIAVSGHVRNPFEKTFALTDRLTVEQAIELAGGLKTSAYPVAYISRRNLFNPAKVEYIRIELENAANTELQPGDQLSIYDNTTFTNVGEVRIYGAVKNPRGFTYDPSLTVKDLLTSAGGFEVGAAFNKVEVFRKILSPTEKVELKTITLEVDSSYNVLSPQGFTFQPFDQIIVRLTPEFSMGRTVQISGQVKYPGTYVLESKRTQLSDVIRMAGGLLKDADLLGSSLYRSFEGRGNISMNVRKAMNHPGDYSCNPILFEGDVININRLENTVTLLENGTRMAQYSTDPDRYQIKNVIFQGRKPADWYIRNFAGGFDKEADRNSVTVTLANNQMQATKRFLFFRSYPIVEPGSTITLKMKPPKVEDNKEKKEVDWNGIWSSTLSASTSALTLYMLIQQLSKAQ
jgi:protein involved in polysaccharide export with SLBB domain